MHKALNEMMPDTYTLLPVEHPVVEAIIMRDAHLRRVPEKQLTPSLLESGPAAA